MSRRLHVATLTALLLAAQVGVLNHAVDHALRADTSPCFVCHSADQFKHTVAGSRAAVLPDLATPEFTPALQPAPRTAVIRAFLARAPPAISC